MRLRPEDALAHYNLACSLSLLRKAEPALRALRQAIHLGYRDFRFIREDSDLDHIRDDRSPDKERRYTVFVQAGHKSLVLMRSPAEQGQKVLMLGDDFWLLMPGSQRPLRITPSQKLLGDASTGDIATMSWSQDYQGTLAGEERCPVEGAAPACLHLSLTAARKGVTYQRIELWLVGAKRTAQPAQRDAEIVQGLSVVRFREALPRSARGFEQVGVDGQAPLVIDVRLRHGRAVDLRLEHRPPRPRGAIR